MIIKATKKPVTIEAIQFDGTLESADEIVNWINHGICYGYPNPFGCDYLIKIRTLEGDHIASRVHLS